ncbi:hypothetical protein [Thermoactinomyces sp. DSM 45892]|uniref:hypothetical protein n=1 Tax=Thermoactinomyces sp. DSM 45892 TaxID=1882753 RepID=UPI00089B38AC|nr:hypothetical protein [Thermoactinomyces sp. DSM 45892]SDZ05210.1 hypothetical protein SAMN05444416_11285 [Thermoactinomyces sp. DSM 45892]
MANTTINVSIGPAIVEFGKANPTVFDVTKGGIQFQMSTSIQEIKVDQYGETPVKTIMKGRNATVTVPFVIQDLEKISKVMPNSAFTQSDGKLRLNVKANSGFDMLSIADQLIIKPTAPGTTPNDYITIPLAGPTADIEYTYDNDNERIAKITFQAYPDSEGLLFIMGDSSVSNGA